MLLSVYGSLRKGLCLHRAIRPYPFIGYGWMKGGNLYNLGPFPCVNLVTDDCHKVRVEVYDVGNSISRFDAIEGFDPNRAATKNLYLRVSVSIQMDDGSTTNTEIYVYSDEALKLVNCGQAIKHGDWVKFEIDRKGSIDHEWLDLSYT